MHREHKDQLELINFKVSSKTKKIFHEICKSRNQQMTSVLNQFIAEFIKSNQNALAGNDLIQPLDFYSDRF